MPTPSNPQLTIEQLCEVLEPMWRAAAWPTPSPAKPQGLSETEPEQAQNTLGPILRLTSTQGSST